MTASAGRWSWRQSWPSGSPPRPSGVACPSATCSPNTRRKAWPATGQPRSEVVEVVALVEVVDEPGLGRLPSQQLAGQRARGRAIGPDEGSQPGEVRSCVPGSDGDHGEVEMPSDHFGDGA